MGDPVGGLREVTFVVDLPDGHEAMVHVNGITDAHREDLAPALFERVPGAAVGVLSYLLPDDLIASYRLAVAPELPRNAGTTREGWLRIHALGRPDPRNPRGLPNPLGDRSSVLVMPGARLHPVWPDSGAARPVSRGAEPPPRVRADAVPVDGGPSLTVLRPSGPTSGRTLVLFDGERWAGLGLRQALGRHPAPPAATVLVPSGSQERRSGLLPHPEPLLRHLEYDVLPALAAVVGAPADPDRTIVAGQSYGGLAAASVVCLRPDLASTAVVQSGSFHFRAGEAHARPPAGQVGDLVERLHAASVSGRFVVQAGTEESGMLDSATRFAEAARAGGADVTLRAYTGGHDYAWWRTGLFDALDLLAASDAVVP
ncbi:enterochelin esterase domain-containing protein [Agromyces sp. NPDC058110]|uniref:enterochelin esterase domain-containing protein n=1 Tax=Agromyces sp. NPDC058110 TaxID=3346345 RepID=UPI0036D807E4